MSRTSKLIYQPTELDKDSLYYLNYETKWNKDNDVENIFGIGHAEISTPIKTTYYKTNLFQLNNGSITDSIENNDIKLISYFRSNLIGYDKHKKLYFPLIIENCAMDCAKTIEFFAKDSLRITYEYNGTYEISLNDIIFDSRIGK